MNNVVKHILNWVRLARLPFHIAGILPFVLGSMIVLYITGDLNWAIFGWSILGVEFILLTVHYSSEYSDYEVDSLSAKLGKNKFSGGSQILQSGIIPRRNSLIAAFVCLIPAILVGLLLQFHYDTGLLTIPMGVIGLLMGLSYSAKPIRWAYRGFGELVIGLCYGWLTLASAYYLQTGKTNAIIHLTAIPVALSIFNVILINEFPDYIADREAGKNNLVVRFGRASMGKLYAVLCFAICISYALAVVSGIPVIALPIFSPIILLALKTAFQVLKGGYKDSRKLEKICAKTLVINLCVSISLVLAILI